MKRWLTENWEVFVKLISETWIPLVMSLAWTIYKMWGTTGSKPNVAGFIETFGATFVVTGYLGAQWVRIKRQGKVESSLSSITQRLEGATSHLTDTISGGDSYCYAACLNVDADGRGLLVVKHFGRFPLYDVSARFVEVKATNADFEIKPDSDIGVIQSLGNVAPGTTCVMGAFPVQLRDGGRYSIFFSARNGIWRQHMQVVRTACDWAVATRLKRRGEFFFRDVSPDYPRKSDGTIAWGDA